MKILLILSFLGILFCQVVTVHPDAQNELLILFLTCSIGFLSSAGILVWRLLKQARRSKQASEPESGCNGLQP